MTLFIIGTILQLACLVAAPLFSSWLWVSALGIIACLLYIIGAWTLPKAYVISGVIAAILTVIGWASWIVAALTTDPGEHISNPVGLLIFPATLACLVLAIISQINRRRASEEIDDYYNAPAGVQMGPDGRPLTRYPHLDHH